MEHNGKSRMAMLALGALGVVYGDIGTSPLYAIRECFHGPYALSVIPGNVFGIISLVFWSLILVISLKYLVIVLNADNRGEGGMLALMTLLTHDTKRKSKFSAVFIALGIFGSSLLLGDGIVTPAISVLSAVEGLNVATRAFEGSIVPISIVILTILFLFQHRGTVKIGNVFGPIMALWFVMISVFGSISIIKTPEILAAINPWNAVMFFIENKGQAFSVIGIVFLTLTGGEALYADMGHFGKSPIRFGWFTMVLPALLLNYFGQGALLLREPASAENLFYHLVPTALIYPVVALATAATIIASQALISGAFSLARQAVQLGFLPRMAVIHTSDERIGQVYVPVVNWALFIGTISLILWFRESSNLASAYGVAVSANMLITTIMMAFIASKLWHMKLPGVVAVAGLFIIIDLAFLGSNLAKLTSGGWIPLAVAAVTILVVRTWQQGRSTLRDNLEKQTLDIQMFVNDLQSRKPTRVPGIAVFLTGNSTGTPRTLLHNFKHNKIIHEYTVLLSVSTEEIPCVCQEERAEVESLGAGMYRIRLKYGFSEDPDVPQALQKLNVGGVGFTPMSTTYFLGRETLLLNGRSKMAKWRKKLFSFLSRNAFDATGFFHLPANRVIELGMQVEL
jgi:KUP system potassium uptake protein